MLDKLKDLDLRYEDLESQLGDPRVYGDAEKLRQVNRELKELLPVVETYRAYQAADSRRREAEELLHDQEMKEMAQDELAEAKEELEQLKEKLTILLLPRDPNDSRNVILEIRGGVGGEESALFAHSLLRMYTMYAESRGWKLEIASINETELGGVKDCSGRPRVADRGPEGRSLELPADARHGSQRGRRGRFGGRRGHSAFVPRIGNRVPGRTARYGCKRVSVRRTLFFAPVPLQVSHFSLYL